MKVHPNPHMHPLPGYQIYHTEFKSKKWTETVGYRIPYTERDTIYLLILRPLQLQTADNGIGKQIRK